MSQVQLDEPQEEPLVSLRRVMKAYGSGELRQLVLADVSLDVDAGEYVSVVGTSGSGKTTLLNVVGGLDRADSGTVISCGVDLTAAGAAELTAYRATALGFVFQFYNLLPTLTALENVEAAIAVTRVPRARARALAREFLGRVGLSAAEAKFPAQLSGGEQQRVALARAVAKGPRLVLADEPTGNLDEASAADVLDLLAELNEETGVTLVVVTHDPAVAAAAARTVRIAAGRVADEQPA